jgi:sugar O-acyltransferase (sialic acid O-acetyltransferase NeuD family)
LSNDKNTKRITFGLVGAGGFGREVMPLAKPNLSSLFPDENVNITFVDLQSTGSKINSVQLMDENTFVGLPAKEKYFNVAIADSRIREQAVDRIVACGAIPLTVTASNVVILDNNIIGVGAILCSFSHITSNTRIGKYFHCNYHCYVAHDCVIGDFVTFAPSVRCNGNVHIGDHAYIGSGACIKQGTNDTPLVIGDGAVVGMGAVVTKSVAPYTTVVGNPAKRLN